MSVFWVADGDTPTLKYGIGVNGSLLPPDDVNFNNTFDLGSGARVWNEGYFGDDVFIAGQTFPTIVLSYAVRS